MSDNVTKDGNAGKHTEGTMEACPRRELFVGGRSVGFVETRFRGGEREADANAHRIAAAWNACEGIPTAALDAGVVKDMLEALQSLAVLFQNDGKAQRKARATIARATGDAQ